MFIPRGFGERSITTKLGRMVYYTAQGEPWDECRSKETLVFLHGFGGGSSAYEWSKVYIPRVKPLCLVPGNVSAGDDELTP